MQQDSWSATLKEAVLMSWLAMLALGGFIGTEISHGSPLIRGGFALLAVLLAMNGMARSELWLTSRGPTWWKDHPLLKKLHHLTDEGEIAGILVGVVIVVTTLLSEGTHGLPHHIPYSEAFTLLGIMSVANATAVHMLPVLEFFARHTGVGGAVFFGSIISSFTGEPAAAVFLSTYVDETVTEENRAKVATGIAATIGSGGGLLPFAAPPILIVWGTLQQKLRWNMLTLFLFIGIPSMLHAAIVARKVRKYLPENPVLSDKVTYPVTPGTWKTLGLIGAMVLLNIFSAHSPITWAINGSAALACLVFTIKQGKHLHESIQPFVLAVLLLALEVVGHEADPLLQALAGMIPPSWPIIIVGLILWYASAFTSHFADNALAARVYIIAALTLGTTIETQSFLAGCVVLGALFGGFALIPANLPNFAIAKILKISPKDWATTAVPEYYFSGIVHVACISVMYFLLP